MELAFASLLLVVIIVGTVDFARAFHYAMELTAAVRAGAQSGAQNTSTAADTGSSGGIQTAAKTVLNADSGIAPYFVSASESCVCASDTSANAGNPTPNSCAGSLYVHAAHGDQRHRHRFEVVRHDHPHGAVSQRDQHRAHRHPARPMSAISVMRKRLLRSDRGETLVEFAIASVVFFTLVFGSLEFGLAVWQYNMVADLAQEGARWASVRGQSTGLGITSANVQTYVTSRAVGLTVTVTTTAAPETLAAGSTIGVTVTSYYLPDTTLLPHSLLTLQSTAQMTIAQ